MFTVTDLVSIQNVQDQMNDFKFNVAGNTTLMSLIETTIGLDEFDSIESLINAAQGNTAHEAMLEELSSELATRIREANSLLRNSVLGLTEELYEDLEEIIAKLEVANSPYKVSLVTPPKIFTSERLGEVHDSYRANESVRITHQTEMFPVMTEDRIKDILTEHLGVRLTEELLDLTLMYKGSLLSVYNKFFRLLVPKTLKEPLVDNLPADLFETVISYYIAEALITAPALQDAVCKPEQYERALAAIRNNSGIKFNLVSYKVNAYMRDYTSKLYTVKISVATGFLDIFINKDTFNRMVEEDPTFDVESVIGTVLIKELGVKEDTPKRAFTNWMKVWERTVLTKRSLKVKYHVLTVMEKFVRSADFVSYLKQYAMVPKASDVKAFDLAVKSKRLTTIEEIRHHCDVFKATNIKFEYDIILYLVCNVFFPELRAYEQLKLMDKLATEHEDVDGRGAALLALPENISQWLVNQVHISK